MHRPEFELTKCAANMTSRRHCHSVLCYIMSLFTELKILSTVCWYISIRNNKPQIHFCIRLNSFPFAVRTILLISDCQSLCNIIFLQASKVSGKTLCEPKTIYMHSNSTQPNKTHIFAYTSNTERDSHPDHTNANH